MSNSGTEIRKKLKLSKIETKDRLSDLHDCVIFHILSFLNIKDAIQTSFLSSRWKNLWKLLPELTFNTEYFPNCESFTKFVSNVLSLRDPSTSLVALDFKNDSKPDMLAPHIVKMIVKYAISHNVQRLGIFVSGAQIPNGVFSCRTLTHLKLAIYRQHIPYSTYGRRKTLFLESFNLPALTSLQLENFKFRARDKDCAEPFSRFKRLNSLLISNCTVSGARTLCISSVTLVNLTLYNQFTNSCIIELCTPSLCTFAFTGIPYEILCRTDVCSLKRVEIYAEVISNQKRPPLNLFNWLLEFPNVNSLTVSASTLQVLYLIPDLLKTNHPSLTNLESLKVKIEPYSYRLRKALGLVMLKKVKAKKKAATIPDGIIDFLLQNSPSAKVDFIDCSNQPTRLTHL